MEKEKCECCGKESDNVHLTCLETNFIIRKLWLCESCYEKYEKPFKNERKGGI